MHKGGSVVRLAVRNTPKKPQGPKVRCVDAINEIANILSFDADALEGHGVLCEVERARIISNARKAAAYLRRLASQSSP